MDVHMHKEWVHVYTRRHRKPDTLIGYDRLKAGGKVKKLQMFYTLTSLSVGLALVTAVTQALADPQPTVPVDVQMALETPKTVVQGEPIILTDTIVNSSSDQRLAMKLGNYGTDWYTLTLTDSMGKSVAAIPDLRPAQPVGLFSTQNGFHGPGSLGSDDIVVTRYFSVTHPGSYTLTAHVHLAYALAPISAEGDIAPYIAASGTVFTHDYVFSLTVLPPDPVRLQKTADDLLKTILDKSAPPDSQTQRLLDKEALFSMPEAAAAPAWEALAKVSPTEAADGLMRVNSPGAADILGRAYADPSLAPSERSVAGLTLNKMYNGGDTSLRTHIQGIGRSFGLTLPDKVEVPIVVD